MQTQLTETRRWNAALILAVVMAMVATWVVMTDRAGATSAPAAPVAAQSDEVPGDLLVTQVSHGATDIFAKYEGIDGESTDDKHANWIQVRSIQWGAQMEDLNSTSGGAGAQLPFLEGFVLTFDYEKATPKLAATLLEGGFIPKLEIELTTTTGDKLTYLRYELTAVQLLNYAVAVEEDKGYPGVSFAHNFQKIKVTYTEFDPATGAAMGNIEYEYDVQGGSVG